MKYATKGTAKTRHQVAVWDSEASAGTARCGAAVDGDLIFAEIDDYLEDPAACKKCRAAIQGPVDPGD